MPKGDMTFFLSSPCIKKRRIPRKRARQGFSLVEMLVAIAVLTLMTLLLAQMFSSVSRTWLGGQARVDNFSKARVLLDLACEDLRSGVFRPDLAAFPGTNLTFYTRRPGFQSGAGDLRDVSLVSYVTQPDGTLLRGDLAVAWTNNASSISFGNTNALPHASSVTARDMASGVLGFRVLFIGTNGGLTSTYAPANGLRGFSVGLAVVDGGTMKKLTSPQLDTLRAGLEGALSGTNSIRADWENHLQSGLNWQSYPKDLGSGLRIFERYVSLP